MHCCRALFIAPLLANPLVAAAQSSGTVATQFAQPSIKPIGSARITFNRHGITSEIAEGFAEKSTQRRLTTEDPARIASVSKMTVAIGVMRLVEQGSLRLDEDVSKQLGWTLRNPAFPDTPITLRQLLSHTSSLTDTAGYWNVPVGEDIRILANDPKAWDSAHAPGTFFRYTNLNFPIVAGIMERATGERFDRLMQRLVFTPMGMHACFNWSGCNTAAIAHAVVLYDDKGAVSKDELKGNAPDCPAIAAKDGSCDLSAWVAGKNGALFSPQGGLRISAKDLARIGMMLLNDGRIDRTRILKPASVRMLLAPQWRYNGSNGAIGAEDAPNRGGFFCSYGLAAQQLAQGDGKRCRDNLFGDGRLHVGHSGNAYGLLSGLWVDRASGTGVAYFGTGLENSSSGQDSAFSAFEEGMAQGRK